jgi:hypothetical protein
MNLAIKIPERFAAMSNHRPGKRGQRLFGNLDRARSEKFVVRDHVPILERDRDWATALAFKVQ